ncbi:MAG: TrkH family potassium uptake protein, partial [Candidatus Brocadiales bacterium]
ALYFGNPVEVKPFACTLVVTVAVGGLMKYLFRTEATVPLPSGGDLSIREGFIAVVAGWVICAFFGALPYLFTASVENFTDAYFESMSGFTTTGATVIQHPGALSPGLACWRSFTQWLGGLGIIVFFIAFLPTTGMVAYRLFEVEVPGPVSERLRPRIAETARVLLQIYIVLTALEFGLLYIGGMTAFDSLCHTFSTISTGGFSTKDSSIAAYQNLYIEMVITVFMFLGACNFVLYYYLVRGNLRPILGNPDLQFFTGLLLLTILLASFSISSQETPFPCALRKTSFQVVSITTTTGFTTEDFNAWPDFCRFLLVLMMLTGGCAGSTASGIKNIRLILLLKSVGREFLRLVTPRVVKHVKLYGESVEEEVISNTFGFFFLYLVLFGLSSLMLTASGRDIITAVSAVAACIGNVGPGLGEVGPSLSYAGLSVMEKWTLIFCMLLGRLEVYSVILVFFYWKR